MKKRGLNLSLKIFAIFLALCAITFYIPHNVLTISAEPLDETVNTAMKTDNINETETETETAWGYVENETEYVDADDESQSGMEIIGGMEEIQPPDETAAEIQVAPDITTIIKDDGGGYYLEDGIYAFQNKGATQLARWLGVEQGELIPGYGMQATLANGLPSVTFDRPFLFKITRNSTSNTYIIRSMLNNRLSFGFSGYDVLTKEIPADDDDVRAFDTFEITFDIANNCILIKPHGANGDAVTLNENEAYLQRSHVDISGNYSKWIVYKYDGATQSGTKLIYSPALTSGALIEDKTYSIKLVTWTTEIGKNTPYAMIHPDTPGMATATWNESTCILTLTTENSGPFKIRSIIRTDGTTTAFRTYYGNYPIIPDVAGDVAYIQNIGTEKYVDIEGPSTAEEKPIQQWNFNGKIQSKWIFQLKSNGYFAIKSKYSSKYIGVDSTDTTKVRQYGTQSDYTLWRIVSTTSGNYKLVCKALESSGLVLAVPLNANANGTDLTMITYTDDSNYRDEWRPVVTLRINIKADSAYAERFSNYSTRLSNSMDIIQERFFELFGVIIECSDVSTFASLGDFCDTLSGGNYLSPCTHGTNSSCNTPDGFGHPNFNVHHKNIHNIMYSFDKPDLNNNTLLVFIGHEELCEIKGGVHKPVTALGKAWSNSGIASIHNNGTELSERKTILHEIGHWYGAKDHYEGNLTIEQIIAGYANDCIYGKYKENDDVMEDLKICQACQNLIKANCFKFDHE